MEAVGDEISKNTQQTLLKVETISYHISCIYKSHRVHLWQILGNPVTDKFWCGSTPWNLSSVFECKPFSVSLAVASTQKLQRKCCPLLFGAEPFRMFFLWLRSSSRSTDRGTPCLLWCYKAPEALLSGWKIQQKVSDCCIITASASRTHFYLECACIIRSLFTLHIEHNCCVNWKRWFIDIEVHINTLKIFHPSDNKKNYHIALGVSVWWHLSTAARMLCW